MTTFVRNLLGEQRRRLVASILGTLEASGDLDPQVRTKILSAINQYHDVVLDVVKSSVDTGMAVNEEALQAIARFNVERARMRRDAR